MISTSALKIFSVVILSVTIPILGSPVVKMMSAVLEALVVVEAQEVVALEVADLEVADLVAQADPAAQFHVQMVLNLTKLSMPVLISMSVQNSKSKFSY